METVKESNPAARPGAQSAMRGLTRYFRAAVARNIPSVPVLPGKGNPNGCVSYKAPARNPGTNQRIRPECLTVHCGGYGAMPSGLVFRGNTGTDGTFPRKCGAKMSRQSPHCSVG